MIKPDNIAGGHDVQDRAPPIRQSAGAKGKTGADKQDRWIGIAKPNERHVACRVADRLLQKRVPQPATACQQILGNGGGITRPFGFDAGLRCRFIHLSGKVMRHVLHVSSPYRAARCRGSRRQRRCPFALSPKRKAGSEARLYRVKICSSDALFSQWASSGYQRSHQNHSGWAMRNLFASLGGILPITSPSLMHEGL